MYLWAVTSAYDLHIINKREADQRLQQTLTAVQGLQRSHGFLYQWYDTDNGKTLLNPGQGDCAETTPSQDNCWFLSAVDNGWYASGLIVVKHAFPEIAGLADKLLAPMDFSIFYDNRPQTACNTNANIAGNQPTGQMYGGYYVDQGPAGYHNGAIYSRPAHRDVHRHGPAPDARRRVVAHLAGAPAEAVRHRPGLLVAGSAAAAGLLGEPEGSAVG